MVIYTFFINWQSIGDDALFEARAAEIVRTSAQLARADNLLAILLGNEIPDWVVKQKGEAFVEGRLRTLYDRVKREAPGIGLS